MFSSKRTFLGCVTFFKSLFIYFGGWRGREGERESLSGFLPISVDPDAGLDLMNCDLSRNQELDT